MGKDEALEERSVLPLWDLEKPLSYMFREYLIGDVYIGRLKKGIVYPKVEEMYWQNPKRRKKTEGKDTGSPVFVPYPSYDIIALWSVPGMCHPDKILEQFVWNIGRSIYWAGVSICYFKFVAYRGSLAKTAPIAKKWKGSSLLYGVLDRAFCLSFYQRFPKHVPKKWHKPAREFLRHIKDRNKPWGTQRVDRPPPIRKMLETGEIIEPFQQLGLDKFYEPIDES